MRLLSLGAASPGADEGTTSNDGREIWQRKLESRALKASVVLDPAVLAEVVVQNGLAKVTLRVAVPHKTIVAEVNAKTLRRTIAAITAAGPDAVAVVLQGRLEPGEILAEAGIAAQLKTPKARGGMSDVCDTRILLCSEQQAILLRALPANHPPRTSRLLLCHRRGSTRTIKNPRGKLWEYVPREIQRTFPCPTRRRTGGSNEGTAGPATRYCAAVPG